MSDWWQDPDNAKEYIKMVEDYPGLLYLEQLRSFLPDGSRVLELGMGPGYDLDILSKFYRMTGTDISEYFLERYRENHPDADLLLLDVTDLSLPESHRSVKYDGIISNKVLMHLTPEEMQISLAAQAGILGAGGLMVHSLWAGEGAEEYNGLHFQYWQPQLLQARLPENTEVLSMETYEEMEKDDSILLVLEVTV